jgi:hypothetical protein
MLVTGRDDALTGLGPFEAKDFLQALSLLFILRQLQLLLSVLLSRCLLLKNTHKLRVKLISPLGHHLLRINPTIGVTAAGPILHTLMQLV